MNKRTWLVALLALSAATLVACGGDDEGDSPAQDAGGSGGSGGGGTGGDGGTGGGGTGGGGTGGTGGSAPMAMPITCGSNTCNPPENPLGALAGLIPGGGAALPIPMGYACCLPDDSCGYAMSDGATGDACNEPAEPDTRCPDFMLSFGGMGAGGTGGVMLPPVMAGFGCCVDNQCGVDGSAFGTGCNENSEARTMLTAAIPMFGALIAGGVPEPRACDAPPPDGGTDEDAGL